MGIKKYSHEQMYSNQTHFLKIIPSHVEPEINNKWEICLLTVVPERFSG